MTSRHAALEQFQQELTSEKECVNPMSFVFQTALIFTPLGVYIVPKYKSCVLKIVAYFKTNQGLPTSTVHSMFIMAMTMKSTTQWYAVLLCYHLIINDLMPSHIIDDELSRSDLNPSLRLILESKLTADVGVEAIRLTEHGLMDGSEEFWIEQFK
jgi:hypothetical protein